MPRNDNAIDEAAIIPHTAASLIIASFVSSLSIALTTVSNNSVAVTMTKIIATSRKIRFIFIISTIADIATIIYRSICASNR